MGANPEFLQQYTKAREDQIDTLADEMLEIADNATNDFVEKAIKNGEVVIVADNELVNRSRLRIDTRKWIAERMKPKKYGAKTETVVTGEVKHVHTITQEDLNERLTLLSNSRADLTN